MRIKVMMRCEVLHCHLPIRQSCKNWLGDHYIGKIAIEINNGPFC